MENKKNKAKIKVEKIANSESAVDTEKVGASVRNENANAKKSIDGKKNQHGATAEKRNAKTDSGKKPNKKLTKEEKIKLRERKTAEKKKIRAEKERIGAEKKIELAKIKEHKRAEKEKAKASAKREKARLKEERIQKAKRLKEERLQNKRRLKEERLARKAMLKNETKKERQRRIAQEKAEKLALKKRKYEDKVAQKKMKAQDKRNKRKENLKDKRSGRKGGYGGWLAAVISLGVVTLALATLLSLNYFMPAQSDNLLESSYRKSFYDTVEQVDNIDLNLSKILASKDKEAVQIYLLDTAINSELCENDLSQLPIKDESKFYTTKLINQIGDYAKYLNKKLTNGGELTDDDRESLLRLYRANLSFKETLQRMIETVGADYSFSSMGEDGESPIIQGFDELQNLSVEYPELIYDGPFSDGIDGREAKGLQGKEVTSAEALETFRTIFKDYNLSDVKNAGETNGVIECYNVQGTSDGEILYAQISKKGGNLVTFSYAGSCNSVKFDEDYAVEKAVAFAESINLKDMKAVWINLSENVYTINLAFEINGVIVYSDLVKVRVCAESGMVIGSEASAYFMNHTDRVVEKAKISEAQAKENVSDVIEIKTSRLAIVPVGTTAEKLCYEISGEYNGETYYVFIDAINGKQVEMFKVIKSTEGTLLM